MPGEASNSSIMLDDAHAALIRSRVSMTLASCDAVLAPSIVRGFGCRIADDRRSVTVFVSAGRAVVVLRDVRASGRLAVVFSRPSTHQTLQLKSIDARVVPLEDGDRAIMSAYAAEFREELIAIGHPDPFAAMLQRFLPDDAVAVRFGIVAAFDQTPGPHAGQRLVTP